MTIFINGTTGISGVDGSAGTPALQGTDTNTGISFGSDVIIGSTGGVERFRVDSQGRLGIGNTSPAALLDVKVASDAKLLVQDGNTTGNVKFNAVNNAVSANVNLEISASNTQFFNGGSERARIDSSGRLLVGTSSAPTAGGGQYSLAVVRGYANGATGAGDISIQRGLAAASGIAVNEQIGLLRFTDNAGYEFANIQCLVDGTAAANDYPGRLSFSTTADGASSPTERMRIASNGVFTSTSSLSDNFGFRIITDTGNQYNLGLYKSTDQATVNEDYIRGTGGATTRFKFVGNGGLYNYSANNSNLSDEREKKNIENLDSTWDCLKHWELKKFHYNEDPNDADKRYGVIAQQVGEYCPEVLTDWIKQDAAPAKFDDNGNEIEPAREEIARIGVKEQQMMWMAIKALQEAQVRIETLETRLNALEVTP